MSNRPDGNGIRSLTTEIMATPSSCARKSLKGELGERGEQGERGEEAKNTMFTTHFDESKGLVNVVNLYQGFFLLPRTRIAKRCCSRLAGAVQDFAGRAERHERHEHVEKCNVHALSL